MLSIRELLRGRVKDQGDRPTCVAFATTSFHELRCPSMIAEKGGIELVLSEEFLFYGCKQRDGLVNVKGTTVAAAGKWLAAEGQCRAELHPYRKAGALPLVPSKKAFADGKTRTVK